MKISTLILSAGYSRRMGETKALLELDGESLLSHIAHVAAPVSDEIVVVAGSIEHLHALTPARAAEALKSLDHPSLHIAEGQSQGHLIDSIRAGLEYISPENALLLWPIDHPFAGAELLQRMFNALKERPHSII
ncbi:nucleotidyltransferase family protein, partial [Myxococcota bacterium]|nr:nucleotidyltransferase family protein [Myxococcota bacterium]